VLASGGLDDRMSRGKVLARAEELMAEAVGASQAFFSTCGSSLSVKAAMLAVASGAEGGLLVGRDSYKSVVAGPIFSGVQPRWITPRRDAHPHFSHPPSPGHVRAAWDEYPMLRPRWSSAPARMATARICARSSTCVISAESR
jgi:arginine decarboxylase